MSTSTAVELGFTMRSDVRKSSPFWPIALADVTIHCVEAGVSAKRAAGSSRTRAGTREEKSFGRIVGILFLRLWRRQTTVRRKNAARSLARPKEVTAPLAAFQKKRPAPPA